MKRILLLIVLALLLGCSGEKVQKEDTGLRIGGTRVKVEVVVIDSCEYILMESGYRGALAHKGNCKYCAERDE